MRISEDIKFALDCFNKDFSCDQCSYKDWNSS